MADLQRKRFRLDWGGYSLDMGEKTLVMGILNVTPDSFSDGGNYFSMDRAVEQALAMEADGADIIDIGGESTRPYADEVTLEQELDRVVPVIEKLSKIVKTPISIDTYKSEVAEAAIDAGAAIINDISALSFDSNMVSVAKKTDVPVILMHIKGTPKDMQNNPVYDDLMGEMKSFFNEAVSRAEAGGIAKEKLILDPGIGFGKTADHNLEILRDLKEFESLGLPLLLGSSRKTFIGKILDKEPENRDTGTMATVAAGIMNGAHIVRVHNVKMAMETVKVMDAILAGKITGL